MEFRYTIIYMYVYGILLYYIDETSLVVNLRVHKTSFYVLLIRFTSLT
jgi:hypothetical protein